MGRYLVICCLAVLLILVQFDLSLSRKLRGRGIISSIISSKGSKPGRPAWHSQTQPRTFHTWTKPSKTEPNLVPSWAKPDLTLSKPVQILQKYDDPMKRARNTGLSQHNPQRNSERILHLQPYNTWNPQILGQPQHPGYGGGSSWDHYDSKLWNPKPPKHKMKHVAAVGARGGYALGSPLSNIRFRFNNDAEKRWWYENRNRYSDQVYYPKYVQPISKDVFVRDCVNVTVKEYIEPTGNQTEDEMETRVVTQVVHKMCKKQYRRLQSSDAEGGNSRRPENTPEGLTPMELETKPLPGAPVSGMALETAGGNRWLDMHFPFNNFDQSWPEKRHRVYSPKYSQPVSGDIFVSNVNLMSGVAGLLASPSVSLSILTLASCFLIH